MQTLLRLNPLSRRPLGNQGFSFLEVLVAAAILGISLLGSVSLYKSMVAQHAQVVVGNVSTEIDKMIESAVQNQARLYMENVSVGSACADGTLPVAQRFASFMSFQTAEGFNFKYISQANWSTYSNQLGQSFGLPASSLGVPTPSRWATVNSQRMSPGWQNQAMAMDRCYYSTIAQPSFLTDNGIYFCLALSATVTASGDSIAEAALNDVQPVFGEFRFVPVDAVSGNPIPCSGLNTILNRLFAVVGTPQKAQTLGYLYFTLYWNRGGPQNRVFKDLTNVFALGWP